MRDNVAAWVEQAGSYEQLVTRLLMNCMAFLQRLELQHRVTFTAEEREFIEGCEAVLDVGLGVEPGTAGGNDA